MKLTGHIEAYITDNNGVKRKVQSRSNAITEGFYSIMAKKLAWGIDFVLDSLFTVNETPPANQKDGIYINTVGVPGGQYSLITTLSQPSTNKLRATGVFTNTTGATIVLGTIVFGKYYFDADPLGSFVDFEIATSQLWPSSVPNGEILTVIWTITFTAY